MRPALIMVFLIFMSLPSIAFAGKQCDDPLATVEKGKCTCPDHYKMLASGQCEEVKLWPFGWPKQSACWCGAVYHSNYGCLWVADPSGSTCLDTVEDEGGTITCPADQRGNQSVYDSVLNTCYWPE